MFVQDSSGL